MSQIQSDIYEEWKTRMQLIGKKKKREDSPPEIIDIKLDS